MHVCVCVSVCVCILLKFRLCLRIALTNEKGHDIISSLFFCKVFHCVQLDFCLLRFMGGLISFFGWVKNWID